jgi:hypothetical protein
MCVFGVFFLLLAVGPMALGAQAADQAPAQVRVFLDCNNCFQDFLRSEIEFVNYVRDRTDADVHVLVTSTETGSGGREYTASFMGSGRFAGVDYTLKAISTTGEPEDVVRRHLATTLRIGLLNYLAQAGVPPQLEVDVEFDTEAARPGGAGDRWNNWIFSLRGSASFEGEESSREMNLGSEISADRITPDWKLTFGAEIDHRREEFDLDEDDPVTVERREREVRWLAVKGLGEHWSIGMDGEVESSTFENTKLSLEAAPAIEYNVFPYSMYTRRQLRALYAIGVRRMSYYEETLFGRTEETRPRHALSLTFEQREQWGSLESRAEWSQYLHDLERTRLEVDSEVSVRILRGLSVSAAVNASRIRDQLSLPRRGATPEEILLRIRQLASGYEYNARLNLTYTFGSIFSAVVNPRFGR